MDQAASQQPSRKIIDYIKSNIGFSSEPYVNEDGIVAIGYGSIVYEDGFPVDIDDEPIEEPYAEYLLQLDLLPHADTVRSGIHVPLAQHRYDALVSFASTIKRQSFYNSTLARLVNENQDSLDIALQFIRWNKKNNRFCKETAIRRQEEANIYFYGIYE
jgi:lysozyme